MESLVQSSVPACSVCSNPFNLTDKLPYTVPCGHYSCCGECIGNASKNPCTQCKQRMQPYGINEAVKNQLEKSTNQLLSEQSQPPSINNSNSSAPLTKPSGNSITNCHNLEHGLLKLIVNSGTGGVIFKQPACFTCGKDITNQEKLIWKCKTCNYEVCTKCRPVYTCLVDEHPPLKVFSEQAKGYDKGSCHCDSCGQFINGSSWHCATCKFDICLKCKPPTGCFKRCPTGAKLALSGAIMGGMPHFCDICKAQIDRVSWRCDICDYDACLSCVPAYCKDPHYHRELKIRNAVYKGYPYGTCFCDLCKKGIEDESWHCGVCKFDICFDCIPKETQLS